MDRNQLDSPLSLKITYVNRYIDFKSTMLVYMFLNGTGHLTGCGLQNFFPSFFYTGLFNSYGCLFFCMF